MRKSSIKNIRINEEVMRELSTIIRDLKDPRIPMMTTVSRVEVAPDLKTCKAFISIMGTEEEQDDCMEGLKSAHGYIRRCLASTLNLRNTPEIRFIKDQSIAYGIEMSQKIDSLTYSDNLDNGETYGEDR